MGWRRAFWVGFAWGWGFFAAGLYWITHAILTEVERFWWLVPIAVPALALPLAVFVAVPAALAVRVRDGLAAGAGASPGPGCCSNCCAAGSSPVSRGTCWARSGPSARCRCRAAAWIGVHGLSLVTVLVAATPLLGWRAMAGGGAVLAGFALFGALRLWPAEPAPQPVGLLIVQGNIAQELKWREEQRIPILRRYIEGTREAALAALRELPADHGLVVIWPETAVPFLLADDPEVRQLVAGALPQRAMLLSGHGAGRARVRRPRAPRVQQPGGDRSGRRGARRVGQGAPGALRRIHAAVAACCRCGIVQGGMDFTPGDRAATVRAGWVPPFGGLICYEVIFPASVVPAERPAWLVNVTNDAWFGISAGPWQHLAAARLRAVEEGLPLARAAQTGVSAVFDARGREVARTELGETGVLQALLPAPREPTPFARLGLVIPITFALGVLALGWWLGRGAERVRRDNLGPGLHIDCLKKRESEKELTKGEATPYSCDTQVGVNA